MAGEIAIVTGYAGQTVYGILRNGANQAFRSDTLVFEAYNNGNFSSYAVYNDAEQGSSSFYPWTIPTPGSASLPDDDYSIVFRARQTGTPVTGDPYLGRAVFSILGGVVQNARQIDTRLVDVQTDVDELQTSVSALSLTSLTSTLADVQTDVDELQVTLATLNTSALATILTDVQTDVDELQTSLAGLSLTALTSAIAAVKAQTDKLQFDASNNVKAVAVNIPIQGYTIVYQIIDGSPVLVSNLPKEADITVARGTTFPLQFLITDASGNAANLTGYKAIFMVKDDLDSPDTSPFILIHKDTGSLGGLTITIPASGIVNSTLLTADTAEEEPYTKFPINVIRYYSLMLFDAANEPLPGPWGRFMIAPFGVHTHTPPS